MSTETIYVGNKVRIGVELLDNSNASGIRLRVRKPDGTEEEILDAVVTGNKIEADYLPTVAGLYRWRAWRATGFATEGSFAVTKSQLNPDA